jgi:hypothetical protein
MERRVLGVVVLHRETRLVRAVQQTF